MLKGYVSPFEHATAYSGRWRPTTTISTVGEQRLIALNLGRVLVILFSCLFACQALAAGSNETALAFAKRSAGKFASELSNVPAAFTLRFSPGTDRGDDVTYNPSEGTAQIVFLLPLRTEMILDRCSAAGTFVGKNAFGSTLRVQRLRCDQLLIEDTLGGFDLGETECERQEPKVSPNSSRRQSEGCNSVTRSLKAHVTPGQYRALKAEGPTFAFEFEPGVGAKAEVVTRDETVDDATVAMPQERLNSVFTMYGRITAVSVLAPGGVVLKQYVRRQR